MGVRLVPTSAFLHLPHHGQVLSTLGLSALASLVLAKATRFARVIWFSCPSVLMATGGVLITVNAGDSQISQERGCLLVVLQ